MQVCDAMECLIRHGIIHRDLAARNVLAFSFHPNKRSDVLVKVRRGVCEYACAYVLKETKRLDCVGWCVRMLCMYAYTYV